MTADEEIDALLRSALSVALVSEGAHWAPRHVMVRLMRLMDELEKQEAPNAR